MLQHASCITLPHESPPHHIPRTHRILHTPPPPPPPCRSIYNPIPSLPPPAPPGSLPTLRKPHPQPAFPNPSFPAPIHAPYTLTHPTLPSTLPYTLPIPPSSTLPYNIWNSPPPQSSPIPLRPNPTPQSLPVRPNRLANPSPVRPCIRSPRSHSPSANLLPAMPQCLFLISCFASCFWLAPWFGRQTEFASAWMYRVGLPYRDGRN
ncbi:hypothetical protein EDC01DRAFT_97993 [Geopyxis carbonaria]|nr:hypothetical protein EDC01DRAFT_97993 [Geopyxis carbonaria]